MGIRIDGTSDLINAADGSLTVEGLSINVSGVVTASDGFKVGSAATIHSTGQFNIGVAHTLFANGNAAFAGITTTNGGLDITVDGKYIKLGASSDLQIYHNTNSYISHTTSGGDLIISSERELALKHGSEQMVRCTNDSTVKLYHDGSEKLSTTASGIEVTGQTSSSTGFVVGSAATISANGNATFSGIVTATSFVPSEGQLSNRNLIINGGMEICQRFAVNSANNLSNTTHTYHVDRFKAYSSAAGGILQAEWEDDNASDAGFQYSVKYSCVDADTSLANDEMVFISQVVELKNMKHLGYGLSWAKTCTLSFYAKSSLTGTYAIALINEGTNNRQYVTEFTISDTNWNRYTITIPGDTSGTWTSTGLRVALCLAAATNRHTTTLGSWQTSSTAYYGTSNTVNFMSSASSRSFSLTGVQLEVGSVATPFEHRSYGDELIRCQRYLQMTDDGGCGVGVANGTASGARIQMQLKTTMRAAPTVSKVGGNIYIYDGSVAVQVSGTSQEYGTVNAMEWEFDSLAAGDPLTAGRPIIAYINGSAGGFKMDAEL